MTNEEFEPVRIRIMQEAYDLADKGDFEGYNSVKVMCGEVQSLLQRTWVGLTDEDISAVDWKRNETLHDFARSIEAKLKDKNT